MDFSAVDPRDDAAYMEWFGVLQRSERFRDQRENGGWQPEEWRARALVPTAGTLIHLYGLRHEGRLVAVGALHVTEDDRDTCEADLFVEPECRRRGYGTIVLGELERRVEEWGRTSIVVRIIEGAHEVGDGPNRHFAPRQGYELADHSVRRDLAWPIETETLDMLEATWLPHASGYHFVSWKDSAPEQFLSGLAGVKGRVMVEAPYENYDPNEIPWTPERIREHESMVSNMGRHLFVSIALDDATNELAGFTELTISTTDPSVAYQWETFVSGPHRGHRLGGLLKIQNLRNAGPWSRETHTISTFNSSLNWPMIAVNEALGARVAGAMVLWRKG